MKNTHTRDRCDMQGSVGSTTEATTTKQQSSTFIYTYPQREFKNKKSVVQEPNKACFLSYSLLPHAPTMRR